MHALAILAHVALDGANNVFEERMLIENGSSRTTILMIVVLWSSWQRAPASDDVDGRRKSGAEDHIAAAMIAAMTMRPVLLPSKVRKEQLGRREELCEPSLFFF
jgi:hypothetical protein